MSGPSSSQCPTQPTALSVLLMMPRSTQVLFQPYSPLGRCSGTQSLQHFCSCTHAQTCAMRLARLHGYGVIRTRACEAMHYFMSSGQYCTCCVCCTFDVHVHSNPFCTKRLALYFPSIIHRHILPLLYSLSRMYLTSSPCSAQS